LNPGTRSRARGEKALRAEVDRVHVAVTVITTIRLGVPVVETALVVHVTAAGHHVLALRRAAVCHALGGVVPVADTSRAVDPLDVMPADGHRQPGSFLPGIPPPPLAGPP